MMLDYDMLLSVIGDMKSPLSTSREARDGIAMLDIPLEYQQEPCPTRLPPSFFLPYVKLFFSHLFPIMPVLDRHVYLDSDLLQGHEKPLTSSNYALLTALAAATVVQLNLPTAFSSEDAPAVSPELLIRHCLEERARMDYIEEPSTSTVMTSFFLFAYYGNMERHSKAWYYLQEAITFAETLNLHDEEASMDLGTVEVQWRRRIFWLLFITERYIFRLPPCDTLKTITSTRLIPHTATDYSSRAYAIQRRTQVKIREFNVQIPTIFESEEPRLIYGFVSLVNLFRAVDVAFVSTWIGQRGKELCSKAWISSLQSKFDVAAPMIAESIETQKLDISVSRLWLRVLVWQLGVRYGLLSFQSYDPVMNLDYPVQLAGELVRLISTTSQQSLDSHGIGMVSFLATHFRIFSSFLYFQLPDY